MYVEIFMGLVGKRYNIVFLLEDYVPQKFCVGSIILCPF